MDACSIVVCLSVLFVVGESIGDVQTVGELVGWLMLVLARRKSVLEGESGPVVDAHLLAPDALFNPDCPFKN